MSGWTDERVGRLKALWQDGLTASQIARELRGVSRAGVLGKLYRLREAEAYEATRPSRPAATAPPGERPSWPAATLAARDRQAIASIRWRALPEATVVAVAEAWNAGLNTADMAADLKCRPATLRLLIGKLVQIGVMMRPARDGPGPVVRERSAAAEAMADEQFRRLARLAEFDPAAKRALELYRRGLGT